MPLPDAEDPKTSNLYAQLRSSQVGSASITSFDLVKDVVFVNAEWEDEARRLKLWGELMGLSSSSGPIAGTTKIEVSAYTGSAVYGYEAFKPPAGEVWTLDAASVTHSGGAGAAIRTKLYLQEGSNTII